jgi:hypothetical protein
MGNKMDEQHELQLASYWNYKFKDAMVHKAPYTKKWQQYMDAYHGEYFKDKKRPEYKSNLVSNYIFSIIETIRPIMLDNDPKFQSMPRQPEGMRFSEDLQEAFSYEWDREKMSRKLYKELITTLVMGTSIFFQPWDSKDKQIKAVPVNPFNIFPDPLATTIEDAEYIIYASYRHVERLKRLFPQKADKLSGGDINYGELVHNNDENAKIDSQVLVLEVWTRDYESLESENGETRQKYPNGRVITLCPEIGVVLTDKANPYEDKEFPFTLIKDYDIPGKFWGEGEVEQLLSPQKYMNELNNAILDNAKTTANMPWIVDKNAGIPKGAITGRPGLILRKNPGSEVRREQPPSLPAFVVNAVETYKGDMEQISGIFDSLKGNSETGVYTAQGILALQEAGQARIRLKVKILEDALGEMARKWFSRMRQFWKEDKWLRISKIDGSYDFRMLIRDALEQDYDFKIMAGSTMPVNRGAMLDLMIRLAQTQMPDGQALVDREAVVEYLPSEVKVAMMKRIQKSTGAMEQQIAELQQVLQQLGEQLQEVAKESQSNDSSTMEVVEQITQAMEQVNGKIVQLEEERAKLEEEKKREEEMNQIKSQSYNEGYADAESLQGESPTEDLGEGEVEELPDEVLQGIEELSDDELELLIASNPSLADLLQ